MAPHLHRDELPIGPALVRRLIDRRFAEYAHLPLHALPASGSSNVLFRLGDELLVRLPRQPGGGAAIDKERRWLPYLRDHLPVAVPQVVAVAEPCADFPERWSIVRWLEGARARAHAPGAAVPDELAADLADVILALRTVAVSAEAARDPSLRWYRGGALAAFDVSTRRAIDACRGLDGLDLDLDAALRVWQRALDLPGADAAGPDHWFHGDLVAENLLLRNGRLSAVLDFGCLAVGDPSVELHGAWELLDAPGRTLLRGRLDVDDAEWGRARAWALALALGTFPYYWSTFPGRCADRLAMARSVLAEAAAEGV